MSVKKSIWIVLGLISIAIKVFASPEWIEYYYSRGFFKFVRLGIDNTLGFLPFPMIYVFIPTLFLWLIFSIYLFWKKSGSWKKKIISATASIAAFIGGGIFVFLILWGYNYGRVPIEEQLGLQLKPVPLDELWEELQGETAEIIRLRQMIPNASDSALTIDVFPENLEENLRNNLIIALESESFPTPGRVRGYLIFPKGVFLRFSSSGLYFPFTGQGQVDGGLHPLQWPYVLTHEMGHGYGFGDEGTCNFLAWWACSQSTNPAIAYMGRLAYWRTLATNYLSYEREKYYAFRKTLPQGIVSDLNAINQNLSEYPDIMPKLRYYAYDSYLKAQGISEGIKNYNRVIMLVKAWKEEQIISSE